GGGELANQGSPPAGGRGRPQETGTGRGSVRGCQSVARIAIDGAEYGSQGSTAAGDAPVPQPQQRQSDLSTGAGLSPEGAGRNGGLHVRPVRSPVARLHSRACRTRGHLPFARRSHLGEESCRPRTQCGTGKPGSAENRGCLPAGRRWKEVALIRGRRDCFRTGARPHSVDTVFS